MIKPRLHRERDHYEAKSPDLLRFLEQDDGPVARWLIRQVLRTWDRQIALLDPAWFRGRRVLEVGCGNPRMLFYFLALGAAEAKGCDLSRRFVDRGLGRRRTYVHTATLDVHPERIQLLHGDALGEALAGETTDTVVCFQSLHHFPLTRFADMCGRLLGPGGLVVISDPVGNHPLRGLADVLGRRSGIMSPDEQSHPPARVRAAFEARGFETLRLQALNPTLEPWFQLTELCLGRWPRAALFSKLPLALLRRVEDGLEAAVLSRWPWLGWRYLVVFRRGGHP